MGERITVVGAGFAGLTALRTLRGHAPDAELTLVAPEAALHYLPGTIWIPAGLRSRAVLQIIQHHHFMWRHLSLPQGRSVTLLTTDELLATIQPERAC